MPKAEKLTKTHEEKIEESIVRSVKTCKSDTRSFLIDRLKDWKKPWEALTESEQRSQIASADAAAETLIRSVAEIIAAEGRTALVGKLDKVAVKDGFQATIKLASKDAHRHALVDAVGLSVLVVVKGVEQLLEEDEADKTKPEADQGDLINEIDKAWKKNDSEAVTHTEDGRVLPPRSIDDLEQMRAKGIKPKAKASSAKDLKNGFNDDD